MISLQLVHLQSRHSAKALPTGASPFRCGGVYRVTERRQRRCQGEVVGEDEPRLDGGIAVRTRGVVYVHSAPPALAAHVEWALARVLGSSVRLLWSAQPCDPSVTR